MEVRTGARGRTWVELERPEKAAIWEAVAPQLAARLREGAGELSDEMLESIRAELPELLGTPDEVAINRASNEANLLLIADMLEAGTDPATAQLPSSTRAYAVFGADRNTPIPGLLRAYRIGHAFAWEVTLSTLAEIVDDGPDFSDAVHLFSAWLHNYIDTVIVQGEIVYAEERERWIRSSSAVRVELVRTILEGGSVDPVSASARLGYELDRRHVAVIAWTEEREAGGGALAATEAAIDATAVAAGHPRPLIHSLGLSATVGWIGSREEIGDEAVAARAPESGTVRLAFGGTGDGIEGFRRSFREASEARRVASLAPAGEETATRYRDVALRALGTVDLPQAREFVHARLEPLLDPERETVRHAETLVAFLDEGGSFGRAAAQLGVHENTVRYRIRQVEDLLDEPVRTGDLELRVALELAADVRD